MESEKAILVTGASTGIGKATALYLDEAGFMVFAGVRKAADGEKLAEAASSRLTPILLDVTNEASIAEAVLDIQQVTGGRLFGLVNNAGLSLNGPLEMIDVAEIRKLMDVNVVGLMAVTKAFLPLLRKSRGRIVNISSGHGVLAVPDKSAYAASKFAVQAISDSLRVELRPFGIKVSNIVVGKVETAVLGKIVAERESMLEAADPEITGLYEPLLTFFQNEVMKIPGIPAEDVGKLIGHVFSSNSPKAEYLFGPGAKKMKNLSRLPRGLREELMYRAVYPRRN